METEDDAPQSTRKKTYEVVNVRKQVRDMSQLLARSPRKLDRIYTLVTIAPVVGLLGVVLHRAVQVSGGVARPAQRNNLRYNQTKGRNQSGRDGSKAHGYPCRQ